MVHNYPKETKYEDSPAQVKRREARNRVRRTAIRKGRIKKGDTREFDHLGFHRLGSLDTVPTRLVSQHANRIRQPKR